MTFDPRFDALAHLIPDELRLYMTGLTGAVFYPSSQSDAVFRLAGPDRSDAYLKVLRAGGARSGSLQDEAGRLE